MKQKQIILVGTQQKTGTVWMNEVFKLIATACDSRYSNISKLDKAADRKKVEDLAKKGSRSVVFFDNHSDFPPYLQKSATAGFRLIRDPRDMILSAIRYHERTEAPFANRPLAKFGGKTLREAILELSSLSDKISFEIEHGVGKNIRALGEQRMEEHIFDVRYEDWIVDYQLTFSLDILKRLGFEGGDLLIALIIIWENSLFGRKGKGSSNHIHNGAPKQFSSMFSEMDHRTFEDSLGHTLDALGYREERQSHSTPVTAPSDADILNLITGHSADESLLKILPQIASVADLGVDELYLRYSSYKLTQGQIELAYEAAWAAYELQPRSPQVLETVGDCSFKKDDIAGAARFYAAADELEPARPRLALKIADAADRLGNAVVAKKTLADAVARYPANGPLRRALQAHLQEV